MNNQTAAIIFTIAFVIQFVMRGYWIEKAKKNPVRESKSFFLDKLNIFLVAVFYMIVPLLALFTSVFGAFDYAPNAITQLLSIPIFTVSTWIFWLSHRDLGTNWSTTLEIKERHSLVTHGIFRYVRHPMYLALWLFVIGTALCIPNYAAGLGSVAAWGLLYLVRIRKEEEMMIERFGDEYRNYMRLTHRLIPRFRAQ